MPSSAVTCQHVQGRWFLNEGPNSTQELAFLPGTRAKKKKKTPTLMVLSIQVGATLKSLI